MTLRPTLLSGQMQKPVRGRTRPGVAADWGLRVRGADVPGRFVIVDGRFIPVEDAAG